MEEQLPTLPFQTTGDTNLQQKSSSDDPTLQQRPSLDASTLQTKPSSDHDPTLPTRFSSDDPTLYAKHSLHDPTLQTKQSSDDPIFRPRPLSAEDEPILQSKSFPPRKTSIQERSRSSLAEKATYVVQVPKEQIFSVPPPENAIIAERYRNPANEAIPRRRYLLYVIIALIVLASIIGLIIGVLSVLFIPEAPGFSIMQVQFKNSTAFSHNKKKHPVQEIKIILMVRNKNERIANLYRNNGEAILSYNGHIIGNGKFPEYDQSADSSTNNELGLISSISDGALANDITRSIEDEKGKNHVSLLLKMNIPVKMMIWKKVTDVICTFKVSSLGVAGPNVLSQHCQSKFK